MTKEATYSKEHKRIKNKNRIDYVNRAKKREINRAGRSRRKRENG
jgi:hypothetical protein